jgi:hypothetical protein
VKVGDLVRHCDGEIGILLDVSWLMMSFPYKIMFPSTGTDWFSEQCIVERVSESR